MIIEASLSGTLDAINALAFDGRQLRSAEREQVARWIAARQGLPGAYGDTFAGFRSELEQGILVFTGERITSASARHTLGEEASRLLRWLGARDGSAISVTLLSSDIGKLYVALAQAIDRLRN